MEKNKVVEDAIKRLQELDQRIDDGDDDSESLLLELNTIMNGIAKGDQINPPKFILKFVNLSTNPDPEFIHEGDSGFDLRAFLKKDVIINEGKVALIPTGLYFEIEKGMEVQIRSRIEIALNTNMFVLNSPGTVSKEIQIILANFDDIPHTIRNGDRIAQGVVCPVYGEGKLTLTKVEKLSEII